MIKEKLVIAICDDENYILDILEKILNNYFLKIESELDTCIIRYNNPNELLKNIYGLDILLLDIEMPEKDGLEVAKEIRKAGMETKIIFLTSYKEYIQKAFEVKAYRYLYKPLVKEHIIKVMNDAMKEIEENEIVLIEKAGIKNYIKINDIYYMEAIGDEVAIYTADKVFLSIKVLQYWEKKLFKSFCRCHRTYLVHLMHVSIIEYDKIVLANKKTLPIAVRKRSETKRKYNEYIIKNAKII